MESKPVILWPALWLMLLVFGNGATATINDPTPKFQDIEGCLSSAVFSADGYSILGSNGHWKERRESIDVWDSRTGRKSYSIRMPSEIFAFDLSPDKKSLITGHDGGFWGSVRLWDVKTGKLKRILAEGDIKNQHVVGMRPVWAVAYSPSGRTVAIGTIIESEESSSGEAFILNARTGKLIRKLPVSFPVRAMSFSPDGKWLAVAPDLGEGISIYSVSTRRLHRILKEHRTIYSLFLAVRFSPDGKRLSSIDEDGTVEIWNISTKKRLRTIPKIGRVPHLRLSAAAFSKDAKTLVISGEGDGYLTKILKIE